jgi:dTDP-4-dehydrorhamnose 3,5-epimerase-like enzyme
MELKKPYMQEIAPKGDDRGTFIPFLNQAEDLPETDGQKIKRIYYVYNYGKGVVRGFHFHQKEWKYFVIVSGAAKFVAINPENEKDQYTFVSSARKPVLVVIPPGFANGWVSLEDNTVLVCGSTASFEESIADDKRFDSYKWGDVWAVKGR